MRRMFSIRVQSMHQLLHPAQAGALVASAVLCVLRRFAVA